MERIVYLLGVDHKYQHNSEHYIPVSKQAISDFKSYLKSICISKRIKTIGEEFHESHLKEDREMSVPKEVASDIGVCHKYCEPDDDEATKLGYKTPLFQGRNESIEEFEKRDRENEKIRELGWISKIMSLNKWPILFICGPLHVKSFSNLLRKQSINVIIVHENWDIQ